MNKIIKIDGTPGVSVPGNRGETGARGTSVFYINDTHRGSLSYNEARSTECYVLYIKGLSEYERVIIIKKATEVFKLYPFQHNDYAFIYSSGRNDTTLFQIDNVDNVYVEGQSEDTKRNLLNSLNEGLKEFGQKSIESEYNEIVNSVMFTTWTTNIRVVYSEYKDSWSQDSAYDISVVANTIDIEYNGMTGSVALMDSSFYPVQTKKTKSYIAFDVISNDPNSGIGDLMVEAEFINQNLLCSMSSMKPELWLGNTSEDTKNIDYPFGYQHNIDYRTNYDNEELGNFSVILKRFDEDSDKAIHMALAKIPANNFSDYVVKLYVYVKSTSTSFKKEYLGELSL